MCNIDFNDKEFMKSNILIDIKNSDIFRVWSENEHKLLNSLLYVYSQKLKDNDFVDSGFYFQDFEIPLSQLRDLMNLSHNSYKKIIVNSLKTIRDFGFNAKYNGKAKYTSFIYEFNNDELELFTQNDKNQKVLITFNKHLFETILNLKNFTILDIQLNKLCSKYAMNIYQIIKMKQKQINPQTKEKITSVKYNLKELNEIFDTSHKYLSKFKHHFENRKKSIIKHDLIKTDFDFDFKKDCVVFKFRNFNKKGN